jgi:hypothetical protein
MMEEKSDENSGALEGKIGQLTVRRTSSFITIIPSFQEPGFIFVRVVSL